MKLTPGGAREVVRCEDTSLCGKAKLQNRAKAVQDGTDL